MSMGTDNPCQSRVAAGIMAFGMESGILIGIIFGIIQRYPFSTYRRLY